MKRNYTFGASSLVSCNPSGQSVGLVGRSVGRKSGKRKDNRPMRACIRGCIMTKKQMETKGT